MGAVFFWGIKEHSQVLEAPGLNTRLCWTRHSSQRTLGSHGPHVLELCLSKEPLTHARKEPLPCLPTAGTAPEHPPWHTLGNVGVQGQLCQLQIPQLEQDCQSRAHLSPGAPLVPLYWAVAMSSTVSLCAVAAEEMSSTWAAVPAAHSPSSAPSLQVQELGRAASSTPK